MSRPSVETLYEILIRVETKVDRMADQQIEDRIRVAVLAAKIAIGGVFASALVGGVTAWVVGHV